MVDRTAQAAAENAAWCDLVCRAHGIDTAWRPSCWTALRRSPMFYPDAVTLRPDATAADVLDSIEAGDGSSVKDSFATLDLAPHGFEVLFDASWIVREPAPLSALGELDWAPVRDRDELAAWAELHGARDVFVVSLLDQPDIAVLAGQAGGELVAGAVTHHDEPVLGVSNLFVTHERWAPALWFDLLAHIGPMQPIVGWERGDALDDARSAGFTPIGPLRVWLHP